jgi:hypothetical protein
MEAPLLPATSEGDIVVSKNDVDRIFFRAATLSRIDACAWGEANRYAEVRIDTLIFLGLVPGWVIDGVRNELSFLRRRFIERLEEAGVAK